MLCEVYVGVPVHNLTHIVHAEEAMCQPPSETDALPFALHFFLFASDTKSSHSAQVFAPFAEELQDESIINLH